MMPTPPLVLDSDLASYPGAPFPDTVLRSAEASVRTQCAWHIAPPFSDILTVEALHPRLLRIPTMRIVAVQSITTGGVTVTGWTVRPGGVLTGVWVIGTLYQVALTHGFDSAYELIPIVAARCLASQTNTAVTQHSETVGQRTASESYQQQPSSEQETALLARYTVRRHPTA